VNANIVIIFIVIVVAVNRPLGVQQLVTEYHEINAVVTCFPLNVS